MGSRYLERLRLNLNILISIPLCFFGHGVKEGRVGRSNNENPWHSFMRSEETDGLDNFIYEERALEMDKWARN